MTCASCHAEIADKAIVCYRCGAPTAGPGPATPVRGRRPSGRILIAAVLVLLAAALCAAWWWHAPAATR